MHPPVDGVGLRKKDGQSSSHNGEVFVSLVGSVISFPLFSVFIVPLSKTTLRTVKSGLFGSFKGGLVIENF